MTAELALFYRIKEGFGLEVIVTAAALGSMEIVIDMRSAPGALIGVTLHSRN